MIEKKPVRGTDRVSVTFRMPAGDHDQGVRSVEVLGDFNEWRPGQHTMRRRKDGAWSLTVRLPRNREFGYRYLVDGREWRTDPEADGERPNRFGSTDGVLRT